MTFIIRRQLHMTTMQ